MELLQLKYFRLLATSNNMTKTANDLMIAPPSLSLTISRLEHELGTTLFDRVGRRIHLNERGRAFLEYINQSLDALETGINLVQALTSQTDTTVSIATTDQRIWADAISAFMQQNPDVMVSHENLGLNQFENSDLLQRFDFILCLESALEDKHFVSRVLFSSNSLMLVVPKNHPLASRKSVRIDELRDERFLMPSQGLSTYEEYMRLCRQNGGFEPKTAAEGGYILREQLLRDGLGVTFFAVDTGARQFANSGVLLKIEGIDYPLSEALFWDKRRKLGRAAERFRDFIIAYYERNHEIPS